MIAIPRVGTHLGEDLIFDFDRDVPRRLILIQFDVPLFVDELVRITRPGGHIAFSLRPDVYENSGFKDKQTALETDGKWRLVEVSGQFQPLPKGEPDVYHQVWVYQTTPSQ